MPNCKSCGKPIIFLKTTNGALMPTELMRKNETTPVAPVETFNGKTHQTHFETCPNADQHRNR